MRERGEGCGTGGFVLTFTKKYISCVSISLLSFRSFQFFAFTKGNMSYISQEQIDKLFSVSRKSPTDGLALLRKLQKQLPNDTNLLLNSGAILIDVGSNLGSEGLVIEGIEIYLDSIDKLKLNEPMLFYNIANGYSSLYELSKKSEGDDFVFNPDETPLLEAKRYFRKALQKSELLKPELRAQLWVNYGNCLSGLGRSAEALSSYDQALCISPTHMMAKGNLAIELNYFSNITRHNIFKLDALELLQEVCSTNFLGKYASIGTKISFESVYKRISDEVAQMGLEKDPKKEKKTEKLMRGPQKKYEQFCVRNQLFLNLCHSCCKCKHYLEDNITFSFQTNIDNATTFIRLSRVINSIKEQYAYARFLFCGFKLFIQIRILFKLIN